MKPNYKQLLIIFLGFILVSCNTTVPETVNKSLDQATKDLENQNFKVEVISQESGNLPANQVISQEPNAGSSVKTGSVVKLTVSKLPLLPNLVGMDINQAKEILSQNQLIGVFKEELKEDIASGQILSQQPLANTPVKNNTKIELKVSKIPTYTINGTLKLISSGITHEYGQCMGTGGFSDIQGEMSVTVKDENQTIIAESSTKNGFQPSGQFSSVQCVFPFKIGNLPKTKFYSIKIGRRGEINYSFEDLQKNKWRVELSLSQDEF